MCDLPLSRPCAEHFVRPIKCPTGTIVPEGKYSSVLLSKCPAVTSAYEHESEVFDIFAQTLQHYKPNQVMLAFNGGKDSTVLLHMLQKFYQNHALEHIKLPVLYVHCDYHFPEIVRFVKETTDFYNIDLIIRKGHIKCVLHDICKEMPHIKAVFMGNRRTDPSCQSAMLMQPTDPGWPPLMRIYPIIDWLYSDIWMHIFTFKVPFCILYEMGYTSIGNRLDTVPNPYLRVMLPGITTCIEKYRPAYKLEDSSLERAGRA